MFVTNVDYEKSLSPGRVFCQDFSLKDQFPVPVTETNIHTEEPLSSCRERCTEKSGAGSLRCAIRLSKNVERRDCAIVPNAIPIKPSFGSLSIPSDRALTAPNAWPATDIPAIDTVSVTSLPETLPVP